MTFNTLASAALLLLSSTFRSTLAGELDVPGYDILARAHIEPLLTQEYKRAPSRTYGLLKNWQGQDFLNSWDFFEWADPTHGSGACT